MTSNERSTAAVLSESTDSETAPSELDSTTAPLQGLDGSAPVSAGKVESINTDATIRVDSDLLISDLMSSKAGSEESNPDLLVLEVGQLRSLLQCLLGIVGPSDIETATGASRKPSRANRPWSAMEERKITALMAEGRTVADVAARFGRTEGAISSRMLRHPDRALIPAGSETGRAELSRPGFDPGAAPSAAASDHSLTGNLTGATDSPPAPTYARSPEVSGLRESDQGPAQRAASVEPSNPSKTDTSLHQRSGEYPNHTRWTWNGGKKIHNGGHPRPGEVVVTGQGKVSHRSLKCPALRAGRRRAMSLGWASSGFYSVPVSLADRYVLRCRACWAGEDR